MSGIFVFGHGHYFKPNAEAYEIKPLAYRNTLHALLEMPTWRGHSSTLVGDTLIRSILFGMQLIPE